MVETNDVETGSTPSTRNEKAVENGNDDDERLSMDVQNGPQQTATSNHANATTTTSSPCHHSFWISRLLQQLKQWLFPPTPISTRTTRILLNGCSTLDEHTARIRRDLHLAEHLHGRIGLKALGFAYRLVVENDTNKHALFYQNTHTRITPINRPHWIAHGVHYNLLARLCQEYYLEYGQFVQKMIHHDDEGGPRPVHVWTTSSSSSSSSHTQPILLVCTGRGQVRAGIFSRQALLTHSIELGSASNVVQLAKQRNMQTILVDPNAYGERYGMEQLHVVLKYYLTLQLQRPIYLWAHSASGGHLVRYLMDHIAQVHRIRGIVFTDSTHNIQWVAPSQQDFVPLQHRRLSASQALRESTLRVPPVKPLLYRFLESDRCVYYRSHNVRQQHDRTNDHPYVAGTIIPTDSFWKHRFGMIITKWAGTDEHAWTNAYCAENAFSSHMDTWLEQDKDDDGGMQEYGASVDEICQRWSSESERGA